MHNSRTPLLACACFLVVKTATAFVPQTRPFGTSSRHLASFREDEENGAAAPRHEPRDPSRPQSECVSAPGRVSPPFDATRFDLDDDLQLMRRDVAEMEVRYEDAIRLSAFETAAHLRERITEGRSRDAELVYSKATCEMNEALAGGDDERARRCQKEREMAKKSMPQFNLHGLWVGKYGNNGYEMVNVTYSGDTLTATKVTGDRHVPRGEISFTANLQPRMYNELDALPPVELLNSAASQWGAKLLPRFVGKGHVADEGYKEVAWVEGQLVLIGDYFGFAWVPQQHQIFFGRPSGELALRMLRDYISEEDEAENARAVAERMYSGHIQDMKGLEGSTRRILKHNDLKDLEREIQ